MTENQLAIEVGLTHPMILKLMLTQKKIPVAIANLDWIQIIATLAGKTKTFNL